MSTKYFVCFKVFTFNSNAYYEPYVPSPGESAGWKQYLTVAQSERVDQMLRDKAPTIPFFRRYCPAD